MEAIIVIAVIVVIGAVILVKKNKAKNEKKDAQREAERQAEIQRVREEERRKAEEDARLNDPCRDLRDGTFNPNYTAEQARAHGYFWCSIERKTLNKSANINQCPGVPGLVG